MALCYFNPRESAHETRMLGWVDIHAESVAAIHGSINELLQMLPDDRTLAIQAAREAATMFFGLDDVSLHAPVDEQEVWAAGVTYLRSRDARMEESTQEDIYERVYDAARPEIFYKAAGHRCMGPFEPVAIRHDSTWDVPEPELAVVFDAHGRIAGYTIGNDMSSRSIEGDNPLYLPQAKIYSASCALGPWIIPADEIDPLDLEIRVTIERGGQEHWTGETSTNQLHRSLAELGDCLFSSLDFPHGAVLLTGTGVVPPSEFTLEGGDVVTIDIEEIGTLVNHVYRLAKRPGHGK
jgi:2-dehydro-3-deoxy-D-arabinonate dehydratase